MFKKSKVSKRDEVMYGTPKETPKQTPKISKCKFHKEHKRHCVDCEK